MDEPAKATEKLEGDALTIAFLKANLEELRTGGIITVAMTNPNVMSYMEHWETRAEKAEAEVERLKAELRRIAEGNLGDDPWQANYARIKQVASEALNPLPLQYLKEMEE